MVLLQKDPNLITVTGSPDIMRQGGVKLCEKCMEIRGANSQQVILTAKLSLSLRGPSGSIESCGKLMLVTSVYDLSNGSPTYPMFLPQFFFGGGPKVANRTELPINSSFRWVIQSPNGSQWFIKNVSSTHAPNLQNLSYTLLFSLWKWEDNFRIPPISMKIPHTILGYPRHLRRHLRYLLCRWWLCSCRREVDGQRFSGWNGLGATWS